MPVETQITPVKIKIAGNAIILTSKIKLNTIAKLEKYNPNALTLSETDPDGYVTEIFRINTGKVGSISKFGITFAEADAAGNATVTVLLPENTANKKAYVKDAFYNTLFLLKDIEDTIEVQVNQLETAFAELDTQIVEV